MTLNWSHPLSTELQDDEDWNSTFKYIWRVSFDKPKFKSFVIRKFLEGINVPDACDKLFPYIHGIPIHDAFGRRIGTVSVPFRNLSAYVLGLSRVHNRQSILTLGLAANVMKSSEWKNYDTLDVNNVVKGRVMIPPNNRIQRTEFGWSLDIDDTQNDDQNGGRKRPGYVLQIDCMQDYYDMSLSAFMDLNDNDIEKRMKEHTIDEDFVPKNVQTAVWDVPAIPQIGGAAEQIGEIEFINDGNYGDPFNKGNECPAVARAMKDIEKNKKVADQNSAIQTKKEKKKNNSVNIISKKTHYENKAENFVEKYLKNGKFQRSKNVQDDISTKLNPGCSKDAYAHSLKVFLETQFNRVVQVQKIKFPVKGSKDKEESIDAATADNKASLESGAVSVPTAAAAVKVDSNASSSLQCADVVSNTSVVSLQYNISDERNAVSARKVEHDHTNQNFCEANKKDSQHVAAHSGPPKTGSGYTLYVNDVPIEETVNSLEKKLGFNPLSKCSILKQLARLKTICKTQLNFEMLASPSKWSPLYAAILLQNLLELNQRGYIRFLQSGDVIRIYMI